MEQKKLFPTSVRLSERCQKQLEFLQNLFGESRTITLTRIIAEAYINEIKYKREKS